MARPVHFDLPMKTSNNILQDKKNDLHATFKFNIYNKLYTITWICVEGTNKIEEVALFKLNYLMLMSHKKVLYHLQNPLNNVPCVNT